MQQLLLYGRGTTYANDPLLGQIGEQLHVYQRGDHALQRAKLRIDAQREEHEEEEHSPELGAGKLINRFRKYDKGQSSTRGALQMMTTCK